MDSNGPWNTNSANWKSQYPIGSNMQDFLLENAKYVIYLRKDSRFACPKHWDPASQSLKEEAPDCEFCFGMGVKVEPSIIPCRLDYGKATLGTEGTFAQDPGFTLKFTSIIYIPRAVYPEVEDIILDCEWGKDIQKLNTVPRGRPLKILSGFAIKQINDRFEREVSWFSCGCLQYTMHADRFNQMVPHLVNLPILDVKWQKKSY